MNFEKHRRSDGTINLIDLFDDSYSVEEAEKCMVSKKSLARAYDFLNDLEQIECVSSRQVAALALATARSLVKAS